MSSCLLSVHEAQALESSWRLFVEGWETGVPAGRAVVGWAPPPGVVIRGVWSCLRSLHSSLLSVQPSKHH